MRVAIIISGNLCKAPYISSYINIFEKLTIDFDIYSWDRLGIEEPETISFSHGQSEGPGYFSRFIAYKKYKDFITTNLLNIKYDKLIICTIAIGVMLFDFLEKNYKNKFIIDIRDNSIVTTLKRNTFADLIKIANLVIISSEGYKQWLPELRNYTISHNITETLLNNQIQPYAVKEIDRKNITTIGSLRDYGVNKTLIKHFRNKEYYFLNYIGSGPAEHQLKCLIKSLNAKNVIFHGYYDKTQETTLLQNASYLNILTDSSINSRTLMSNRFYLSVSLGIPMMVFSDTYQGKVAKAFNLGFLLNRHDNLALQLDFYKEKFSPALYNEGRNKFIDEVKDEVANFSTKIIKFLNF